MRRGNEPRLQDVVRISPSLDAFRSLQEPFICAHAQEHGISERGHPGYFGPRALIDQPRGGNGSACHIVHFLAQDEDASLTRNERDSMLGEKPSVQPQWLYSDCSSRLKAEASHFIGGCGCAKHPTDTASMG